jgi:hypothetical protein
MFRRFVIVLATACVIAALLAPAAATARPSFDKAVGQLIRQHYPQSVEAYLDSLGDTTLGFRLAGSPADNAAADYIEGQFNDMKLSDVRQEAVPVDVWDMQGAWVRVGGRTVAASQFDGVPGTAGAITAPVVDVGLGTFADFAGKDVTGKIVLVDLELDEWWLNYPGCLAALQGAKAVIATWGEATAPWYSPLDCLGANDGEYDLSWAPMVYISRADGAWLKQRLAKGPVTATVRSDVTVTMHDFDDLSTSGLGYNVVAEIPGSDPSAGAVLIASHHDAHFRAGLDDTGAVANMLLVAKAMQLSGYKPQRTVIFLATTGEEFGYTDAWYDWCAGAWYAATVTHASGTEEPWTGAGGKVAVFLNLELMARKGAKLSMSSSTALAPWLQAAAKASPGLLPNGFSLETPIDTWEDGWTFTAAGVPSMVMEAGGKHYDRIYHTTVETKALMDYAYLGKIARFIYKLDRRADTGLLPYDLRAQADTLTRAVDTKALKDAGVPAATVTALAQALHEYTVAVTAFATRSIPAAHQAAVNDGLAAAESYWNTHLTGLDAWDYQAFPFQQTLYDVQNLDLAIAHLGATPAETDAALEALAAVCITGYGIEFGQEAYTQNLVRYMPDYPQITWGGQVNGAWHVDILSEIAQVQDGDLQGAIAGLTTVRDGELNGVQVPAYEGNGMVHIDGLIERVTDMTAALNAMTAMVDALK